MSASCFSKSAQPLSPFFMESCAMAMEETVINAAMNNTRIFNIASSPLIKKYLRRYTFRLLLLFRTLRPQDALIFLRDRPQAFVNKLLDALPAIGLRHVDIAFRIRSDGVRAVEFTRLASTLPECRQHFECVAQEDVDAVVLPISQINILLLRVLEKCDVPRRT